MLPRFQPLRSGLVSYQGADTILQSAVRRTIGLPCMGEAKASICCLQIDLLWLEEEGEEIYLVYYEVDGGFCGVLCL